MVNIKFTKSIGVPVLAVLFIVLVTANTTQAISYEEFLQSVGDAVETENLQVTQLPKEVLNLMKEELYENKVVKDFSTATKDELTQVLKTDMKSRENYYKKNKKIFKAFVLKTMDADMNNYPDENSGINPLEIDFLSMMTTSAVDKIIEEIIEKKKAPQDASWKVLTLVDAFRTVYFYCKYPKEMAPFLTEPMRVDVKAWLDDTATWGNWGFESNASENESNLKLEL